MIRSYSCIVAIVVLLVSPTLGHATKIHVPADQPTIQAGMDAAADGDTVLVWPGTYSENLSFGTKNIVLLSANGPANTILTPASLASPIVTINGGQTNAAGLAGFTITGTAGAITRNGVYVLNSSPQIHHNILRNNADGCVLRVTGSARPVISYNLFHDNPSCTWAVYCDGSTPIDFVNNTIVNALRGMWIWSAGSIVENNIVTGCDWGTYTNGALMTRPYNDIWGNDENYYRTPPDPLDIASDPLFENAPAGDYQLSHDSPCIDAGDPEPQYNDPDGTRNDMGAFPLSKFYPIPTAINLGSEDAAHVVNHTPTIYWSYADTLPSSQVAYEMEVGTNDDWAEAETWASGEIVSSDTFVLYTSALLNDGSRYYLRVRLSNYNGWGEWRMSSFRMNSTPSQPIPLSPINQAVVNVNAVRCYVQNATDDEADRLQYDFEIYSDAELTTLIHGQYGVSEAQDSTTTGRVIGLDSNASYWWRSRSYDEFEYSLWSQSESFTTRPPARGPIIRIPTDELTIQDGIDTAVDGDTVVLAAGTYTGDGNRDVSVIHKNVCITSETIADTCVIDCQGAEYNEHQAFWVVGGTVAFRCITVINGHAFGYSAPAYHLAYGGAIVCDSGAAVQIEHCIFRVNQGAWGGAVAGRNSLATLSDCRFESNLAGHGGAIYWLNGDLSVRSCVMYLNRCGNGGQSNSMAMTIVYSSANAPWTATGRKTTAVAFPRTVGLPSLKTV